MRLALRDGGMDHWWVIERLEHDGREWLEPDENGFTFQCSSRISDADVEGNDDEMKAIAAAIRGRRSVSFKRCAVRIAGSSVFFWSPRNSQTEAECSIAEADELAAAIEAQFPDEFRHLTEQGERDVEEAVDRAMSEAPSETDVGALVGKVMRAIKGRGNPVYAADLVRERLRRKW